MTDERTYAVKYVGDGVRTVPGVGSFQEGTVCRLPAPEATELCRDDDFVLLGSGPPVGRVRLRVGPDEPGSPSWPEEGAGGGEGGPGWDPPDGEPEPVDEETESPDEEAPG